MHTVYMQITAKFACTQSLSLVAAV